MAECRLERASEHVWWFTPDERSDRPALALVAGSEACVLLDVGASPTHTRSFLTALAPLGLPPLRCAVLTHWHWDHSFGGAALDVPIAAQRSSADELALQASYDWADEAALDQRVADGRELAFCAEMLRVEMPDRSDFRIALPQIVFDDALELRLGGVSCRVEHVGGDHAADSCVAFVPEDGLLFLGDCLYQRLYAPVEHHTVEALRPLVEHIAAFHARRAIEGHGDEVADEAALAARLGALREACEQVEALGEGALATARGEDERETIEFLLAGRRLAVAT